MACEPEAMRTRAHREQFERAIRDNVTIEEAGRRIAAERWARIDAKLAAKRTLIDAQEDRQSGFWWDR